MLMSEHAHSEADVKVVSLVDDLCVDALRSKFLRGAFIAVQRRLGIRLQQPRQSGDVDVIRVLMSDEDAAQASQFLEAGRERPRVDQDSRTPSSTRRQA